MILEFSFINYECLAWQDRQAFLSTAFDSFNMQLKTKCVYNLQDSGKTGITHLIEPYTDFHGPDRYL